MENRTYIFVMWDEQNDFCADTKGEVEKAITQFENTDRDVPWTIVAKIRTVEGRLDLGFNEGLIEYYKEEYKKDNQFVSNVINAITQYILDEQY